MNLGWVTLHVSDMKKSVEFYRDVLGLPVEREFDSGGQHITFLGLPNSAKIELISSGTVGAEPVGVGVSIGFETDGLDAKIETIKMQIDRPVTGPISPNPAIRFFFVPDPDGYTIQLCEIKH